MAAIAQQFAMMEEALRQNLPVQADYFASDILYQDSRNVGAWIGSGRAALMLGNPAAAKRFFEMAKALDEYYGSNTGAWLAEVAKVHEQPAHPGPRYLVIREWGHGFWSDVDHVVCGLLAAEATGRTPIVHWGVHSKFRPKDHAGSAWDLYFEPVSGEAISAARRDGLTYFPSRWSRDSMEAGITQRWNGPESRVGLQSLLARPENVVVSDFHTSVTIVSRWLPPEHELFNKPIGHILRALVRKYLRPRAEITDEVKRIRESWGPGPIIAMHLRGTDKGIEVTHADEVMRQLMDYGVKGAQEKGARLFLITDSAQAVVDLRARLGDALITLDTIRSDGKKGIHTTGEHDPVRLAREVMIDSYLAAECDEFIGLGFSNVACMIARLKEWPQGTLHLVGHQVQVVPNSFLMLVKRPD